METGRKKMKIKSLSLESDSDKAMGGYAATRWRKKPVEIDAIRWTGENKAAVLAFCDGTAWVKNGVLRISTLEGSHIASVGDYIIRGVKGEYYPCKADVFMATYERVEGGCDVL